MEKGKDPCQALWHNLHRIQINGVWRVLDISWCGQVRPSHANPVPVYDKNRLIFDTLFKTFNPKPYPVQDICQEKIPCVRQSDKIDDLFKTKIL